MRTWTKRSTRLRSLTLALIISLSLWGSAFADFGFGGVNDFNFDFDFDFNFDFDFSIPDIPDVPNVPSGGNSGSGKDLYWSEYDEKYLNSGQYETVESAKQDYAKAQDDYMNANTQAEKDAAQAAMDEAHLRAESARADSSGNYSGGKDGSEYIPLGGGGSSGSYIPPSVSPSIPDGSVSIGSADLTDQKGNNLSRGSIKSGYGFFADVKIDSANVSKISVTASYDFGNGTRTIALADMGSGSFEFSVNSQSPTAKRCVYIPVETKDDSYTVTFTVNGTDGNGKVIKATKQSKLTVKGSMFDDDFTGDR